MFVFFGTGALDKIFIGWGGFGVDDFGGGFVATVLLRDGLGNGLNFGGGAVSGWGSDGECIGGGDEEKDKREEGWEELGDIDSLDRLCPHRIYGQFTGRKGA